MPLVWDTELTAIDNTDRSPTVANRDSNNRHVVPSSSGGWDIKKPDATRASGHANTQQQAVDRAREIVTNLGGGEVRIHGRNGQIRDTDTVGGGNDPHPPIDRK